MRIVSDKNERLPIKVVFSRKQDKTKNTGGGQTKFFGEVTPELRKSLSDKFVSLNKYYSKNFKEFPEVPCVGKIKIKNKAIAKSHKPNKIFNPDTCPIIGSNTFDEIFIKLTKTGIDTVISEMKNNSTEKFKSNLTVIDNILPYTSEDIFSEFSKEEMYKQINSGRPVKLKLFNFDNQQDNKNSHQNFYRLLEKYNLIDNLEEISFSDLFKTFKVNNCDKNSLDNIAGFSALKTISPIRTINTAPIKSYSVKSIDPSEYKKPGKSEYPVIGVVDSGIKADHPLLEPWIYARESFVPEEYQNNQHGTFVAGLIQYGDIFNNFKNRSNQKFKFLDVVVIPNDDPQYGKVDHLTEDQFIEIMNEVVPKYSNEVKIWNLSLGSSIMCKNDEISDLAVFLDELSDKYEVKFILSSGNYNTPPFRSWPPVKDLGENDRITSPADSIRSLTVGSIAHKDSDNSIVKKHEPSPFSRRGPGANYVIKPEVVDYGGNLDSEWSCNNLGVFSLGEDCSIFENIGTSFSTPLVTNTYAAINNSLDNQDLLTSKALLIHSARLSNSVKINKDEENKYYGFGHPNILPADILSCRNDKVTLIFNELIKKGEHLELYDFPYPESLLRNNKWYGEIYMTLAYDPPLDPNFGQEYCRVNINASLGTYKEINENGELKFDYSGEVPLEKNWDSKYEKERIQNGFKWSPIKSYYRKIPRGIKNQDWKLRVDFLNRNENNTAKQRFVLVITIIDPEGADIYTDVVNQLRQNAFTFNNLKLKQQVRQRY